MTDISAQNTDDVMDVRVLKEIEAASSDTTLGPLAVSVHVWQYMQKSAVYSNNPVLKTARIQQEEDGRHMLYLDHNNDEKTDGASPRQMLKTLLDECERRVRTVSIPCSDTSTLSLAVDDVNKTVSAYISVDVSSKIVLVTGTDKEVEMCTGILRETWGLSDDTMTTSVVSTTTSTGPRLKLRTHELRDDVKERRRDQADDEDSDKYGEDGQSGTVYQSADDDAESADELATGGLIIIKVDENLWQYMLKNERYSTPIDKVRQYFSVDVEGVAEAASVDAEGPRDSVCLVFAGDNPFDVDHAKREVSRVIAECKTQASTTDVPCPDNKVYTKIAKYLKTINKASCYVATSPGKVLVTGTEVERLTCVEKMRGMGLVTDSVKPTKPSVATEQAATPRSDAETPSKPEPASGAANTSQTPMSSAETRFMQEEFASGKGATMRPTMTDEFGPSRGGFGSAASSSMSGARPFGTAAGGMLSAAGGRSTGVKLTTSDDTSSSPFSREMVPMEKHLWRYLEKKRSAQLNELREIYCVTLAATTDDDTNMVFVRMGAEDKDVLDCAEDSLYQLHEQVREAIMSATIETNVEELPQPLREAIEQLDVGTDALIEVRGGHIIIVGPKEEIAMVHQKLEQFMQSIASQARPGGDQSAAFGAGGMEAMTERLLSGQGMQGMMGRQGMAGMLGQSMQGMMGGQGAQGLQAMLGGQGMQGLQAMMASQGGMQGLQAMMAGQGMQGMMPGQSMQGMMPGQSMQGRPAITSRPSQGQGSLSHSMQSMMDPRIHEVNDQPVQSQSATVQDMLGHGSDAATQKPPAPQPAATQPVKSVLKSPTTDNVAERAIGVGTAGRTGAVKTVDGSSAQEDQWDPATLDNTNENLNEAQKTWVKDYMKNRPQPATSAPVKTTQPHHVDTQRVKHDDVEQLLHHGMTRKVHFADKMHSAAVASVDEKSRNEQVSRPRLGRAAEVGNLREDATAQVSCSVCAPSDTSLESVSSNGRHCTHSFCLSCIETYFPEGPGSSDAACPVCGTRRRGTRPDGGPAPTQPADGRMMITYDNSLKLPGFESTSRGVIIITYAFPAGTQTTDHPHPGRKYPAATRTAFIPQTGEGARVVDLLQKAFDARLIFTVVTTPSGQDELCWNDVHHKTNIFGGPPQCGYPDPVYLRRVQSELATKGVYQ